MDPTSNLMGRINAIENLAIRNNLLPFLRAAEAERRLLVSQVASRGTQIIAQQTTVQAQQTTIQAQQTTIQAQQTEIQAQATCILQLQEQLGALQQSSGGSMSVNIDSTDRPISATGTNSVNTSVDSSPYVIDAPVDVEFQ